MANQLLYQIFECTIVIFETMIVYIFLEGLFFRNNSQGNIVILYIAFNIGLAIFSLYFQTGIALTLYILLGVYILMLVCYKTSLSSRIIAVFYFIAIMMIAEIIVAILLANVWGITLSAVLTYSLPRVFGTLIAKLIQVIIIKLTVTFTNWKGNRISKDEFKMMLPLLVCQIFSLGVAYYIAMISLTFDIDFSLPTLFALLGLTYINIIAFWYFDRIKLVYELKGKNAAAEYKLALEKRYYQILKEHQNETNALWHDMKKHINLVKNLIATGESDLSREYIRALEVEMDERHKVVLTRYPVLSALLTEQKKQAKKVGVPYEIDIRIVSDLKIEPVDLCIILSNLFDNALEACCLMPDDAERRIHLFIGQHNQAVLLKLTNNYTPEKRNNRHPGIQGMGLRNIRQAVEKYDGSFRILKKQNIFVAEIILP